MSVTVRVAGPLRRLLGDRQQIEAEGQNVGEVVENLGICGELPLDESGLPRFVSIHVNDGKDIRHLAGRNTPVKDGDTVTILWAIAGGSGPCI